MVPAGNTLAKAERLSGRKQVAALLEGGRWGAYGHFRYCWIVPPSCHPPDVVSSATGKGPGDDPQGAAPARILVSVPKRFFKRAVKRNLLKRRIREAYRVQKIVGADILFQYNSAEIASFAEIQADIAVILSRVSLSVAAPSAPGKGPGDDPQGADHPGIACPKADAAPSAPGKDPVK